MAGNLKRSFVKIFSEKLLWETVQIVPNFPAKSLSIYFKKFYGNFLSNKRIEKLVLLVKQENKYHTRNILEFINFHSIR